MSLHVSPHRPKFHRLLSVAVVAGLAGSASLLSPERSPLQAHRMPSSSSMSPKAVERRLESLFDSYYRISACATVRFREHATGQAAIASKVKALPLAQVPSVDFALDYLTSRIESASGTTHIGSSCLPDLNLIQTPEAWVRDLEPLLASNAGPEVPEGWANAFPILITNLLEDPEGNVRPLSASARKGWVRILRANWSHVQPDSLLDIRHERPITPELALRWGARLGDIEAFETIRKYVAANIALPKLREDSLLGYRMAVGTSLLTEFDPRGNREFAALKRMGLLGIACMPWTTVELMDHIQAHLREPLPKKCEASRREAIRQRMKSPAAQGANR